MSEDMFGYPVEILSIDKGRALGNPVAMVALRPDPINNLDSVLILFSQEQSIRLRDTLDRFLNDPESWLFVPPFEQLEIVDEIE